MNRGTTQNANKVSNLIQRYEDLAKNNRRPILRRWMSATSTIIESTDGKSSIARRLDKVAIPRNKPNGNGCCREVGFNSRADVIKKAVDGEVQISVTNGETVESPNISEDIQTPTFRKNSQIPVTKYDHTKLHNLFRTETKYPPLKTRSIEDFEELIYFDEITKGDSQLLSEPICENTRKNSIETVRKRAKEEEEKYRRSFNDELEDYEDTLHDDTEIDDANNVPKSVEHNESREINNNINEIKPNIKKDKKEFVVDELISSERIYIKHLELVIKHYLHYFQQQKYKNDTIKTIFSNIESIHEHSQIFLLHLESCNYNYAEIGKVFCKHRGLFDKYPKYCRERSKSHNLVTSDFKQIVAHLQLKYEDKLGLNSSLLKPIQRLAKYELLLNNLNNMLQNEGATIASIQNAITLIQRTARIADTMVILNKILRCPYDYNDVGPLILQEGFKLLSPEKIDTTVFLFGKMLIFTEKAASKEEYNYKHSIPMDELRLNCRKSRSLLLLEHYNNKMKKATIIYTLEAKDAKVLNLWFGETHRILWEQLKTFKGNTQREAFKSSLEHFRSIDKTDSTERLHRITTNDKANKNSTQVEKGAKIEPSNKKQTDVTPNKQNVKKPSLTIKSHSVKSIQKKYVNTTDKEKEKRKAIDRKMAMIHRM